MSLGKFLRGSPRSRPPARLEESERNHAPENKPAAPVRNAAKAEATPSMPARLISWRECIERLLQADGYVVQGSSEELSKGSSMRMWGSDLGWRISGPASYQDALRQWKIYQETIGEEMESPPPPSSSWHYYAFEVAQGKPPDSDQ